MVGRFLSVASEWLVAQHRTSVVDRTHHVVEVHERRRVHRDEIDVCGQCVLHGGFVAWADHLDIEAEALIRRSRRMLTEPGTDDRDFQWPFTAHPSLYRPVSPRRPRRRVR